MLLNPLKNLRKSVFKNRLLDFLLGFVGFALAAASAYFPFYVYLNSDDFHPPMMVYSGQSEVDGVPTEVSQRPRFENIELDQLVTGSISAASKNPPVVQQTRRDPLLQNSDVELLQIRSNQSFPMQLVFASKGRALIRSGNDMVAVAAGSRLPDGSRVKEIAKDNGVWRLVTTEDRTLLIQ